MHNMTVYRAVGDTHLWTLRDTQCFCIGAPLAMPSWTTQLDL